LPLKRKTGVPRRGVREVKPDLDLDHEIDEEEDRDQEVEEDPDHEVEGGGVEVARAEVGVGIEGEEGLGVDHGTDPGAEIDQDLLVAEDLQTVIISQMLMHRVIQ